jgi:hypothetical protein
VGSQYSEQLKRVLKVFRHQDQIYQDLSRFEGPVALRIFRQKQSFV